MWIPGFVPQSPEGSKIATSKKMDFDSKGGKDVHHSLPPEREPIKARRLRPPKRGHIKARIFESLLDGFRVVSDRSGQRLRKMLHVGLDPMTREESDCMSGEKSDSMGITYSREIQEFVKESDCMSSEKSDSMTITDSHKNQEFVNRAASSGATLVEGSQSMTTQEKHILECKLYFFLFLLDCEFDKDSMVQLWVADGIFEPEIEERMEILAGAIFDSMVEMKFLIPSRLDNVYGLMKYRLDFNPTYSVDFLDEAAKMILPSDDDYLVVGEAQLGGISKLTKHLSIICEDFNLRTAELLKDFKDLSTLILFCERGTSINHVPHDLFLYLKNLKTLDLHNFSISELPSSLEYLESLRYLDVSGTPIKFLPESIDSLYLLQTLKLNGCLDLHRLPKNMRHLICLRHLDLDIVGQLNSMPKGMGSLTSLQTLRAFLVGREDGCRVKELKNLVNLTGSFCISRLENISNSDEAREAELSNKTYLSKLQLRWSSRHCDGSDAEDGILECLQPHFGIKELDILFFGGTKLPTWISNSSFTEIINISLFQCRNCSMLPPLGRLPSLKFLEIYEMNEIKVIDHSFCRNDGGQESQAFPKLEKLTFDGMMKLEAWTGVENGDFPSLLEFKLKYCPKLLSVRFLAKCRSLQFLEIVECAELKSLPEDGLPASLNTFIVKDSPKIKERWANRNAQEWSKISHVRSLFLDYEEICSEKPMTEDLNG